MYVLICNRVVKRNTGSKEKFAPRAANYESLRVSGPFRSFRAAQRTTEVVLGTHTCLDAQIWSEEQVIAKLAHHATGHYLEQALIEAKRLLAAYTPKLRQPAVGAVEAATK